MKLLLLSLLSYSLLVFFLCISRVQTMHLIRLLLSIKVSLTIASQEKDNANIWNL